MNQEEIKILQQRIENSQNIIRLEQMTIDSCREMLKKQTGTQDVDPRTHCKVEMDPEYNPWDRLITDIKTDADFKAEFEQTEDDGIIK